MKLLRSLPLRIFPVIVFFLLSSLTTPAQTANVPARVTQPVDLENLVTLQGNTHPLARPKFDQGAAPDSLPMERMLLVLERSAEQETALRKLLDEQQVKSSPNYHLWLTPQQFGEQFGPADADIQAVTDWLTSQGFEINRVATGRTVIEFSGTAGAVRQAFHTEIHKFAVNGEEHWANASDPQIPAALAPVVAGFASLNNFPRQPMIERLGAFSRSKATGEVRPLFTVPTSNGDYYALGPTDFATIYNVLPLWQGTPAVDGTGQSLAIVAESNINVQDVQDFRSIFGLPANNPQIIVNGVDPGVTMTATESEADLDTEWAGAVAKNATIYLVVSESTESTAGVDLSAVYIIDNNLAPIMSESFSACEAALGTGGNAFQNALHEQGAAQGITIVVASGDNGSAGCDYAEMEVAAKNGLAVSGVASTPFNVAVGGTDFNDAGNWTPYWSNSNNSTTLSSALSYIPEMTWNDSCARIGVANNCASAGSDTPVGIDLVAGSGGESNCAASTGTTTSVTCTGGYAKPAWQSGTGVPNDSVRDLPDISLFAGDGMISRSFYALCEADAVPGEISCNQSSSNWVFLGAGGTSASTPAFAGIMALVNQKTGARQGNANYVLYPLAAKSGARCTSSATMASTANSSPCIFYDTVTGNNSVACAAGTANCGNTAGSGYGILEVNPPTNASPAWSTTTGYDLATGLGSVNAANLVNKWTSVSFTPTTTTLTNLSPTAITHGQPVNFAINVAPSSGSGTPTGDVSLIAQAGSSPSNVTGIGSFALSNGSFSGATNMLPGGSYGVTAHYAGDGTFGASDSTPPVQVTVSPEGSQAHVALLTFDPVTGQETSSNATSFQYGSAYTLLRVDVTNSSGQLCSSGTYPCPTGQVTLTDNGQQLDLPTYGLNSEGYTEDQTTQFRAESNNVVAAYSGDKSYQSSTSPTDVITMTPASSTTTLSGLPVTAVMNTCCSFTVDVTTQSRGMAPPSQIEIQYGNTTVTPGGDYNDTKGSPTTFASVQAALGWPLLQPGPTSITAIYPGDNFYAASSSAPATVTITDFSVAANPTNVNISAPGQSGTTTVTLTPLYGFTGTVALSCNTSYAGISCNISPSSVNLSGSAAVTTTLTITTTGPVNAVSVAPPQRKPPSLQSPTRWLWPLAGLLALVAIIGLGTAQRRPAGLVFGGALMVVGIWVACGGGGGGGSNPPPPAPVVSLYPGSLSFSQENVGTTSAAQSVLLANIGNALLNISNIGFTGTNAADFAQTSNCQDILSGSQCTINVTFTPLATGSRSASLAITDNASGSPQTVSLTGTGAQLSVAVFSPTTLAFGQENTGLTTPPQTVTLSNTGSAPLNITAIALAGQEPFAFAQSNTCGTSVVPGANCTISVTFTPNFTGAFSAYLSFVDNAAGSPQTVSLSGTGDPPVTPAGTYYCFVNAASGPDQHSPSVTISVQ